MYKEIDLGNKNKIIFFHDVDFWDNLLTKVAQGSNFLDIVTYNFNFQRQGENSFYNKLLSLAEQGVFIRLMYAPEVSDDSDFDEVFSNDILCVSIPHNHSKIFLTDKIAYIGSANFSFGSNSNYECGFLTENEEIIAKIQDEIINRGIWNIRGLEINSVPDVFDPLSQCKHLINHVNETTAKMQMCEVCIDDIYFDYTLLIDLHNAISNSFIPCDFEKLKDYYRDFKNWEPSTNYYDSNKDCIVEFQKMLNYLQEYLTVLKMQIESTYKRHGKYSITH